MTFSDGENVNKQIKIPFVRERWDIGTILCLFISISYILNSGDSGETIFNQLLLKNLGQVTSIVESYLHVMQAAASQEARQI